MLNVVFNPVSIPAYFYTHIKLVRLVAAVTATAATVTAAIVVIVVVSSIIAEVCNKGHI